MLRRIAGKFIALLLLSCFAAPVTGWAENPGQNKVAAGPSATPAVAASKATAPPPGPSPLAAGSPPAVAQNATKTAAAKADGQAVAEKKRAKPRPTRCEPQSLTYARQRSGIMSCRNGWENGPVTWFTAEQKAGRTSAEPAAGSVLILKGQGHGMPTGHVAYVEEVIPEGPTTYRLIFSHTNYDRKCHLETNIEAFYDRAAMTLDVRSGAWQSWGRGLQVAGFIHKEVVVDAATPPVVIEAEPVD